MEKILVGIDLRNASLWAGVHALNLAKRIDGKVFFLLVADHARGVEKNSGEEIKASLKGKIESLIEEGRSDGVTVDYYLAYGNYETELIRFSQENKITLLVVEPPVESGKPTERSSNFLEKIRHRINCRIEVVHKKAILSGSVGKTKIKKRR